MKGSKKSERSPRKSLLSGDLGKIKDLGFQQKTIDKLLFCMKEDSRLGVFFLVTTIQEIVGLVSEASTIVMMIKTGFYVEGLLLLLLKVVLNCTYFFCHFKNPIFLQYLGVTVFLLQIRGMKLFETTSGCWRWILPLVLYVLSPLLQLATYLGFIFSWSRGNTKNEVWKIKQLSLFL